VMDILNGEVVLPDETPAQAVARVERSDLCVTDGVAVEVSTPGGIGRVFVSRDHAAALVAGQLYVGLYNRSGCVPDREDFRPVDWTPNERADMGLPPRQQRRKLLEASNADPFVAAEQIGLAPIHVFHSPYTGAESLRAHVRLAHAGFVTHFVIGTRDKIVTAGAWTHPLPMHAGDHLTIGVAMPPALPPAKERMIGTSKRGADDDET
jgi:hypothetical protein